MKIVHQGCHPFLDYNLDWQVLTTHAGQCRAQIRVRRVGNHAAYTTESWEAAPTYFDAEEDAMRWIGFAIARRLSLPEDAGFDVAPAL